MCNSTVTTMITASVRVAGRRVLAFALLCAVAVVPVSADEIFKSTDGQGRPVYTDRPLSPSAERIVIQPSPPPAAAQANAAQMQATIERLEERRRQEEAKQAEKLAAQEAQQKRVQSCRRARDRYLMFAEANRLYRRDAQGNRVYYTAAEIDAERTTADKAMKELCDETPR